MSPENIRRLQQLGVSDKETIDTLTRTGHDKTADVIAHVEQLFEDQIADRHAALFPSGLVLDTYDFSIEYLQTHAVIHLDTGVFLIESNIDYATF